MPADHPVPLTQSLLLRVARDIHERVSARTLHSLPALNVSDEQWDHLHALCLLSQKARRRRLFVAAAEVDWQIRAAAQSLIRPMHDFCDRWDQLASQGSHTSTCREIYDDLVHLAEEFDDVRIDRRNQMLTVRTEPIELEGVNLGPFDIALHWSDIGRGHKPYRVLAVDPQKAARDSSVTHPHVQSDQLCEGDGKQPIVRALERGELFEFFVLVRQVLRTYHSGSAYQQLEDWFDDGRDECTDCGCCLDEYERNSCDRCSDKIKQNAEQIAELAGQPDDQVEDTIEALARDSANRAEVLLDRAQDLNIQRLIDGMEAVDFFSGELEDLVD